VFAAENFFHGRIKRKLFLFNKLLDKQENLWYYLGEENGTTRQHGGK
jgi:hypothetical protein